MDWAEDEDEDSTALPALEIIKNANGTETHISYRWREDGKKVKTTRIIKKIVNKTRVDPRVAERRGWAKFGASAADSAGPQSATTSVGENIELHPRQGYKGMESQETTGANAEMEKKRDALKNATVKCRICNGEHFTARCPFKGTMAPEGEPAAGEPAADPMAEPAPGGMGAGKSSYVPPALRKGGAAVAGERMGGKFERDDLATLRVTNVCYHFLSNRFVTHRRRRSASTPKKTKCGQCSSAGDASQGFSWPRTARLEEQRALLLSASRIAAMRQRLARRWMGLGTTTLSCVWSLQRRRRRTFLRRMHATAFQGNYSFCQYFLILRL